MSSSDDIVDIVEDDIVDIVEDDIIEDGIIEDGIIEDGIMKSDSEYSDYSYYFSDSDIEDGDIEDNIEDDKEDGKEFKIKDLLMNIFKLPKSMEFVSYATANKTIYLYYFKCNKYINDNLGYYGFYYDKQTNEIVFSFTHYGSVTIIGKIIVPDEFDDIFKDECYYYHDMVIVHHNRNYKKYMEAIGRPI
jgi:hypothetical protein